LSIRQQISLCGLANANVPAPSFRDALATDYVTDAILAAAKNNNWEKVKQRVLAV